MSHSFHSPIGSGNPGLDATETAAREAADQERGEHERERDAWTFAVAHALVEARPRLSLPLAPAPAQVASAANSESVKVPTLGHADVGSGELSSGGVASSGDSAPPGPALPSRLIAELSDSRLGRLELSVARGVQGLRIVINVADAHVKALIESERALLLKNLQGCGLRVDSVEIAGQPLTGTALAPEEAAQERALARSKGNAGLRSGNARWRGYSAPPEDEPEEDTERVDLTA